MWKGCFWISSVFLILKSEIASIEKVLPTLVLLLLVRSESLTVFLKFSSEWVFRSRRIVLHLTHCEHIPGSLTSRLDSTIGILHTLSSERFAVIEFCEELLHVSIRPRHRLPSTSIATSFCLLVWSKEVFTKCCLTIASFCRLYHLILAHALRFIFDVFIIDDCLNVVYNRFIRNTGIWLTWTKRITLATVWRLSVLLLFMRSMNTLSLASWDCSLLYLNIELVWISRAIFIATNERFFLACILVKLPLTSLFIGRFFRIICNYCCFNILWWILGENPIFDLILNSGIIRRSSGCRHILPIPTSLRTLIWLLMKLYHEFSIIFALLYFQDLRLNEFTYIFAPSLLVCWTYSWPISKFYSIQPHLVSLG